MHVYQVEQSVEQNWQNAIRADVSLSSRFIFATVTLSGTSMTRSFLEHGCVPSSQGTKLRQDYKSTTFHKQSTAFHKQFQIQVTNLTTRDKKTWHRSAVRVVRNQYIQSPIITRKALYYDSYTGIFFPRKTNLPV